MSALQSTGLNGESLFLFFFPFAGNAIRKQGAKCLAEALKVNSSLTYLHLACLEQTFFFFFLLFPICLNKLILFLFLM
jgi:hypothetical protein